MPPKTIKKALKDTLEDLSKEDLDKFRGQLIDRRQEPRVRRNKVEGKNFLDIADVLVSTFTESGALQVTVEILKDIDCNDAAESLVEDLGAQSSKPGSSDTVSSSAGASGASNVADDSKRETLQRKVPAKERLLSVRAEFVKRVSDPVLNQLLDKLTECCIINDEEMHLARVKHKEDKARDVIDMVRSKGSEASSVLINALCELDRFLAKELNFS